MHRILAESQCCAINRFESALREQLEPTRSVTTQHGSQLLWRCTKERPEVLLIAADPGSSALEQRSLSARAHWSSRPSSRGGRTRRRPSARVGPASPSSRRTAKTAGQQCIGSMLCSSLVWFSSMPPQLRCYTRSLMKSDRFAASPKASEPACGLRLRRSEHFGWLARFPAADIPASSRALFR